MKKERLWHTIRLCMIPSGGKRAEYIRKKKIFHSVGEKCIFMDRKIPLYANLIKLGNNVHLASNITFVTHDVTHKMLNNIQGKRQQPFCETVGCIEIMDNVFVGTNVTILNNVRIGSNVIVAAGSVVTKDVPENSVVAGVPARVICSLDAHMAKRKNLYPAELKPRGQQVSAELEKMLWEDFVTKRDRI